MNVWERARPFHWGLLLVVDQETDEVPEPEGEAVVWTRTGVAIPVRHASDVDITSYQDDQEVPPALVRLRVELGEPPPAGVSATGRIVVPSGHLTIGDADDEDLFAVPAGTHDVAVLLEPSTFAEAVTLWVSETTGTADCDVSDDAWLASFEEMNGLLHGLRIRLADRLSDGEHEHVVLFLDHNELGLALETMVEGLLPGSGLAPAERREILELARRMGIDVSPSLPPGGP